MTPRVTIVMPVYNTARYIGQAVRSALASRFTDFELLVLDDGSTDDSVGEAERAAAGDPRLRVVRLPHGGVAAARNAALAEARAPLIANLDADDVMLPERLGLQVAFLDAHPECVAVGGRSLNMKSTGEPLSLSCHYYTHEAIDASLLDGNGGAVGNDTAMFRRDAVAGIGGYEAFLHTSGEDHDLWLRLAEVGRLANLPDVLNLYRVHESNASLGPDSKARRLPITTATLTRAFARRGITDREPVKVARPPLRTWERLTDRAIMQRFRGQRRAALWSALGALALNPLAPPAHRALSLVLSPERLERLMA